MFKLDFNIPEAPFKITLQDSILLIGSCFSDEIGSLLEQNKFHCISNPYGTIYNPISIFKLLSDRADSNHTVENQGITYHWDTHSTISGLSKKETTELFVKKHTQAREFLANSKWLIITLGTSIVYELEGGQIVGNCHKVPASNFTKRFLSKEEILSQYNVLHSHLKKVNSGLNVIFTISPVRHIKDGLIANNRSKAILVDAVHTIVDQYDGISYFPSYEILMDELRDYRFYSEDMIHPSKQAIKYVWDKFSKSYFDPKTLELLHDWNKLCTAITHKPFHPKSEQHQQFLDSALKKALQLNEKMDLSVEIELLKSKLK